MWFERLTGFRESAAGRVADQFVLDGDRLTSRANGRVFTAGTFEAPTVGELRQRLEATGPAAGPAGPPTMVLPAVAEVVDDVTALHADPANAGALFQVASQFNALEMISPDVTPENGIDRYEHDGTQGPACAIACGAGTIYRNYLLALDGGVGQTTHRQLNCLADLAAALGHDIEMRNGYAFPTLDQLDAIAAQLAGLDAADRDRLMAKLRIGLAWNTEVTAVATAERSGHLVSQAYCSALPVGYSHHRTHRWEPFAQLVLDGAYEATLTAAALNAEATGNRRVYLTLLGGGVFANRLDWIINAIGRSLERLADTGPTVEPLEVVIVSHRQRQRALKPLLKRWSPPN